MYLAYCEAGFAERRIALVQAVLAKPRWRRDELGLATTPPLALQSSALIGARRYLGHRRAALASKAESDDAIREQRV